ncbi:sigma-70 family RNA polymerase sigma factor [bacterium]|nr:sigma-70 family RNA polymerase sigma factor [bacterium]
MTDSLRMVDKPLQVADRAVVDETARKRGAIDRGIGEERESRRHRDAELVKRTQDGDKSAFQELFSHYEPKVLALAREILGSREDAEDVVQESFVKAYLALSKYRGDSAFYTWLYRIVYNMAIDQKRRVKRRGGTPVEFQEEILNSESISTSYEGRRTSGDDPYKRLENHESLVVLERALQQLSEEQRAVILLRERDGLRYEEIADVVGVSKGTVMSRLHYARKALREVAEG